MIESWHEWQNHESIDVSIVIVNWNTKDYLIKCLRSIYETTKNLDYEIYVVDNGSSDGSPEAVMKQFPQVRLIRNNNNLGFARANNIAISKSSGRYICLINSDILVLNRCIKNLLTLMDSHPRVGLASPRILNPDRTLQPNWRKFPTLWRSLLRTFAVDRLLPTSPHFLGKSNNYWTNKPVRNVDVLMGCFWIIRRQAIAQVGLMDEDFFMYGEDIDWCKRFHKSGWDVVYYSNAEAIHFGGMSSSNEPIRFYIEIYKSRLKYWKKHHGGLGKACYVAVTVLHQLLRIIPNLILYLILRSKRKTIVRKIERSAACLRWLVSV